MKLLYSGTLEWGTTSLQRMRALRDAVDDLHCLDSRLLVSDYVRRGGWERAKIRMAWPPLVREAGRLLTGEVEKYVPDCVWIDQGILVSANTLQRIRRLYPSCKLVHYTPDSLNASGMRHPLFRHALSNYDLCITTKRRETVLYRSAGAANAYFSWQGYDDSFHMPFVLTGEEMKKFKNDVVFIGQNMPKRASQLARIAQELDCRIGLYGRGWKKGPGAGVLGGYYRGWLQGQDYAKAISGAEIALCFLNNEVDDDYTTRTFEIPACGTMMLAERTEAHQQLFNEGREAAFFDTTEECLEKVGYYLSHDRERRSIAEAGRRKVESMNCTWNDRMRECIEEIRKL